jgi:hypothetical protein
MDERAPVLSFDEWLDRVFENPVSTQGYDRVVDCGLCPPDVQVDYLARVFEHPEEYLAPYSNAQINQSFWFLLSTDSDAGDALVDANVPWSMRARCLATIPSLFERLFASRCDPGLSHLDEVRSNPLNSACYMWWDLFPTWGRPDDPTQAESDGLLLGVMSRLLGLEHEACWESALHGLGHWALHYPNQVATIVEDFLERHALRPELELYARAARYGCIQ